MSQVKLFDKAIGAIEDQGFLLTFPIKNRPEPHSLWTSLYPGSEMNWNWDYDADNRVVSLWQLREQLAKSLQVVYGKFYKNRATFFSKSVFVNLLCLSMKLEEDQSLSLERFSNEARLILEVLEMDSPLSTKQLRKATELQGKFFERSFIKGTQELWNSFLICGVGEIDDGAFPSLAYAATKTYFEDLYQQAISKTPEQAFEELLSYPHVIECFLC